MYVYLGKGTAGCDCMSVCPVWGKGHTGTLSPGGRGGGWLQWNVSVCAPMGMHVCVCTCLCVSLHARDMGGGWEDTGR